ncbi:hypothetical protein Tco_0260443 [Tanacetum coccineum]
MTPSPEGVASPHNQVGSSPEGNGTLPFTHARGNPYRPRQDSNMRPCLGGFVSKLGLASALALALALTLALASASASASASVLVFWYLFGLHRIETSSSTESALWTLRSVFVFFSFCFMFGKLLMFTAAALVLIPETTFVGVESSVLIPETTFVGVESRVLIPETTFVGAESRVLILEMTVWDTLVYPSDTLVIRKQKLE